jgi:hypothetical protein
MSASPSTRAKKRGIPTNLSLDPDAAALLRAMQPNGKGLGALVSELVRREAESRAQRPALLAALAVVAAQHGEV